MMHANNHDQAMASQINSLINNLQERIAVLEQNKTQIHNDLQATKNNQLVVRPYVFDKTEMVAAEDCTLASSDAVESSDVVELRCQVRTLKTQNVLLQNELSRLNTCCKLLQESSERCAQIESRKFATDTMLSTLQMQCVQNDCEINFLKSQLNHISNLENCWKLVLQQVISRCDAKMQTTVKQEIMRLLKEDHIFKEKEIHSPYPSRRQSLNSTSNVVNESSTSKA